MTNQARADLEAAEELLQEAVDAGDVSTTVYQLIAAVISRQRSLGHPPAPAEIMEAHHLRQRAELVTPSAYGKRPQSHAKPRTGGAEGDGMPAPRHQQHRADASTSNHDEHDDHDDDEASDETFTETWLPGPRGLYGA